MSEHAESKTSPIPAVIMLLVIAGLITWGIGLMNDGAYGPAAVAALIAFLFGLYMVLKVGKP